MSKESMREDITHKCTNFKEHAEDIGIEPQASCSVELSNMSFWWSAHWSDVTCELCLLQKDKDPSTHFDLSSKAVLTIIENHAANYALDIFPEPKEGDIRDLWCAKMARHTCDVLARLIRDQVKL